MIGYRPSSLLRMAAWMSVPTALLWFISPTRAIRRTERRAAWNVARQVRGAFSGHRTAQRIEPPALRPIRDAMAQPDIDGVKSWGEKATTLFPVPAAKMLANINRNAPVGEVRDDAKVLLDDIRAKQAEM